MRSSQGSSHCRSPPESRVCENGPRWLVLGCTDARVDSRFIMVEVCSHLCAGGGVKEHLDVGVKIDVAMAI